MQTVLVINSKGGSGKTTIAANLASLYAASHLKTALMDYDPQGSSLHWYSMREENGFPPIHMVDAGHIRSGVTRTFQLSIPHDVERVVIDAPAGMCKKMLNEMVVKADVIVVPVIPSPIDIHATSEFIYELKLIVNACYKNRAEIGVVANRVRNDRALYQPLHHFINELKVPFIATLSDSDNYIRAVERGMGIHEMSLPSVRGELVQWLPLVKWLANGRAISPPSHMLSASASS